MTFVRLIFRTLVPMSTRYAMNKKWRMWRGYRTFTRLSKFKLVDDRTLDDMRFGWGNTDFSASSEYLRECITQAEETPEDILECGSGLSTLLVATVAKRRRKRFVSLENDQAWAARVDQELKKHAIEDEVVSWAPLVSYEQFDWYESKAALKEGNRFSLILCDGPPGSTKGGRVGLVPVISKMLTDACVIVLDDYGRPGEREAVATWTNLLPMSVESKGITKPFAVIHT